MSLISTISLVLGVVLTIKNFRRLDAGIAVTSAVVIYVFAYLVICVFNMYLNSIVTDNIVANALIVSIKPFMIDNIQGEVQPAIIGLLLIALWDYAINRFNLHYR